jgi:hypothetical protein
VISELAELIREGGAPDPRPEELADILWLASVIAASGTGADAGTETAPTSGPEPTQSPSGHDQGPTTPPHADTHSSRDPHERPDRRATEPADSASGYPARGGMHSPAGPDSPETRPATLVRGLGEPGLTNTLDLMRALRALNRHVPSDTEFELDEDANLVRRLDERMLLPALRPRPSRWLRLAFVQADSPSMALWRSEIHELHQGMARLGAFRDIRRWSFAERPDSDGTAVEVRRYTSAAVPRPALRPRDIVDPTGRQLVLVLTDTVGPMWHTGAAQRLLAEWARTSPVAILHLLPSGLWSRGGAAPIPAMIRAPGPGAPNVRWQTFTRLSRRRSEVQGRTVIPVMSLEPGDLRPWAALTAGDGRWERMAALVVEAGYTPIGGAQRPETTTAGREREPDPVSHPIATDPDPQELIRRFRFSSSAGAWRLAGLLSAVAPVTVPIARMIQRAMVPGSSRGDLAELFLSSLLRREPLAASGETEPGEPLDRAAFDFVPGVREAILTGQYRHDTRQVRELVHEEVSAYVERRRDRLGRDQTVLTGVLGTSTALAEGPPFASLSPAGTRRPGERPEEVRHGVGQYPNASTAWPPTLRPDPEMPVEPTLPHQRDSRAVIVGASSYTHLMPLPSVRASAVDLSAVLTEPADAPFMTERTTLIIDPADPTQVLSAIHSASKDCGDTLLVYFAGHGLVTRHGDLVLATTGTDRGQDYTGISYNSIRRIVATSHARRTLVVLDCCLSGRAVDAMGPPTGLTDAPGTYVLTAAGANRLTFAPPDHRHTAFTGSLIDILRHGLSGGARLLDIESIHRELKAQARRLAFPVPELRSRPGARPLALASNAAYHAADAVPAVLRAVGSMAKVIDHGVGDGDTINAQVEPEIRTAAREGRLARYVAQHPDTANPALYRFVADIVFERLTRRLERGRGHHRCAASTDFLLPECHDRFQDDVEAVLNDLLKHADKQIANLGGWIASRLNAVTVDGNRKRRGARGAQQRPRLPLWLGDALGQDPWLLSLALDLLTWVGEPTVAPGGLWPLDAWADRRGAVTGDPGVTERQVATDVERVLAAMKQNPAWYERYVERPLGYKQVPLASATHDDGDHLRQLEFLLSGGPDEASESRLRELAAAVIDAVQARLRAGDDPRAAAVDVLGQVLAGTGSEQIEHAPKAGNVMDENLARLLADPDTEARLIEAIVALAVDDVGGGPEEGGESGE